MPSVKSPYEVGMQYIDGVMRSVDRNRENAVIYPMMLGYMMGSFYNKPYSDFWKVIAEFAGAFPIKETTTNGNESKTQVRRKVPQASKVQSGKRRAAKPSTRIQ